MAFRPVDKIAASDGREIRVKGETVPAGGRRQMEIPAARLPTDTWLSLPIEVVNGARPGPTIWLSSAVHGDELNGVEIIRRVLDKLDEKKLAGAVIAAPIVNVFGFVNRSRYLPDRRDLNRSFPGSPRGSLAARLAHLFLTEVVSQCEYGIDLHTGSHFRTNLPQIRANLQDEETRRCAAAFGAPVMLHAATRDGSLREAATRRGKHVLVYEAGEPLRFDREAIKLGVRGVLRVMAALSIRKAKNPTVSPKPRELSGSAWVRARRSGILRLDAGLGQEADKKGMLGVIADVFGEETSRIYAPRRGIVIGHTTNPLVNRGDAVINLGHID